MHGSNLKDPKNQFLFISSIPIKFVSGMVLTVLIAASVLYMGVPQMWGDAQASTQNARDDAAMIEEQLATPTLAESGQPNVHSDGWDLDFGENGKVNTGCASWADVLDPSTSDAPNNNHYSRVRIQSTGKILLSISCDRQWTLARYNIDGTVDASFGTNGKIVTDFNIFAVQNDDKILAELGLSIARFDADGQPDLSFGNGGVADALASSDPSAWFTKVVLQENGQITALGKMGDQRIIARYNSDGTLDTTFNGSGYLLSATGHQSADFRECLYGSGLAVQSDGKYWLLTASMS